MLILPKKADFLERNADVSKINRALVLKGIFMNLFINKVNLYKVYLFILTPCPPQNKPLKNPPRLGLKQRIRYKDFGIYFTEGLSLINIKCKFPIFTKNVNI